MASPEQGGWKERLKKWVVPGALVAGILGLIAVAVA
jgi:hypothetical protein